MTASFFSCGLQRKRAENNNNVLKYVTVEGKRQDILDVTPSNPLKHLKNRQISSSSFSQGSVCMNPNQFCGLFERSRPEELPWEPNTFKNGFLLAFTKPIGTLTWLYTIRRWVQSLQPHNSSHSSADLLSSLFVEGGSDQFSTKCLSGKRQCLVC